LDAVINDIAVCYVPSCCLVIFDLIGVFFICRLTNSVGRKFCFLCEDFAISFETFGAADPVQDVEKGNYFEHESSIF